MKTKSLLVFGIIAVNLIGVNLALADLEWTGGYGIAVMHNGKGFEVADLDGDSDKEVIFVSYNQRQNLKSCVYVIECENGNYSDRWRSQDFSTRLTCLDIADVDQDDVLEVIVGGEDGRVLVFNGITFELEWESVDFGSMVNDLDVTDVDADEQVEIVASIGTELFIINGINHSIEWQSYGLDLSGSVILVTNVDDDAQSEILLGTLDWINGRVYILDGITHLQQWQSPVFDDEITSIWVEDVDNDGNLEILIGSSDVFEGLLDPGVHVFQTITYELEWVKPGSTFGTSCVAISADVDQDGTKEILISESTLDASYVHVYDGIHHQLEWQENVVVEWRFGPHSLWVDDVDMDGVNELLVRRSIGSLQVLDGQSYVEEWKSWHPGYRVQQVKGVDVDDDGTVEIVGATEEGYVFILNGVTKEEKWRSDCLATSPYDLLWSMAIKDADNDGVKEIIVGMETGVYVFNGVTHSLEWYKTNLGYELCALDVGDVDNDGICEIITGDKVGIVFAYDVLSHDLKWQTDDLGYGICDISIGDVDLDDEQEIAVGIGTFNYQNYVYILDGATQIIEWSSADYRQAIKTVTISDIDDDVAPEILFSIQSGEVYVIDGITHLTEWISADLGIDVYGLVGEDVDIDGVTEIVVGSESGIYVFNGITHEQKLQIETIGVRELCATDIDDDQKIEIFGGISGYMYIFAVTGPMRGDVNGDGIIDIADVLYLISYLFRGGYAPDPLWVGDTNGDDLVDLGDVLYLISYLYKGGPPPCS